MRPIVLVSLLMLNLALGAVQAREPTARVGEQTRSWLELQKSGAQASQTPSIIPGEVADRVYRRYLESYSHPIPEHFRRVEFGGDS